MIRIETENFRSLVTPESSRLDEVVRGAGFDLRIVGGAVRDSLLGNPPKDVDFASNASPETMIELLDGAGIRTIPTGLQHGTITAVVDRSPFEITTLRADTGTDGRHAEVAFLNPETLKNMGRDGEDSWKVDAERRDLTFNAMSATLSGDLYDYFGGVEDLKSGTVRFVGDAAQRIQEDYLRILRFFRFHGRFGKPHFYSQPTVQAIRANAGGLKRISGERIWMETSKILMGMNVASELVVMAETGVAQEIGLPVSGNGVTNWREAVRISRCTDEPVTVLSTLCETSDNMLALAASWKMSSRERDLGVFLVANRPLHKSPYERFEDLCVNGAPNTGVAELLRSFRRTGEAKRIEKWKVPEMPVKGRDLIAAGLRPGPEIGRTLEDIKDTWRASRYTAGRETLLSSLSGTEPTEIRQTRRTDATVR